MQTLLCRDLVVEKQHRCSYTGGKAVYSHLHNQWIACMNNEEISFLCTQSGEIVFNMNALGQRCHTLSPLSRTVRNQQEMDGIITFDLALADNYIVFVTRHHFVRIAQIMYNEKGDADMDDNDEAPALPVNVGLLKEFKIAHTNIGSIVQLVLNVQGDLIICGTGNGSIICLDINNGHTVHKWLNLHFLPITMLKINAFKHHELISSSNDTKLKCINLRDKSVVNLPQIHQSSVVAVDFIRHPNGDQKLMISVAMQDCIGIYDIANYAKLKIIDTKHSLTSVSCLRDRYLVFGDENGCVYVNELSSSLHLTFHEKQSQRICHSAIKDICSVRGRGRDDEMMINITTLDCNFHFGRICVNEPAVFEQTSTLIGYNDEVLDADVVNDDVVVLASNSCNLKVCNVKTFAFKLLVGHSDIIMSVAVAENGMIASCSKDKTVRFWNGEKCVAVSKLSASGNCIRYLDGDNLFVCGSSDGALKLLDLAHCIQTIHCHEAQQGGVSNLDVSLNRKYVVSCGEDGKINLFHFDEGENEDNMQLKLVDSTTIGRKKQGKSIWCVKFSRNDKLMASAHDNGEIRLWKLFPSLSCVKVLSYWSNIAILDLLFINHSTQIVATSSNGELLVWSLKENECVKHYKQHYNKVWRVLPLREHQYMTIGCDSMINIWSDQTMHNEQQKLNELHQTEMNKTRINNFIHNKNYKNAVKLCLSLNQPQKLFDLLLNKTLQQFDFEQIIFSLNAEELAALITLLIDFNTRNNKFQYLCQLLLNIIYSKFELSDLLKLQLNKTFVNEKNQVINTETPEILISNRQQNFAQLNSALLAYSTRHLQRVENLLLNLNIINFE